MTIRILILAAFLSPIAACGRDQATPSAAQDQEMNRAAEMLDEAPNGLSEIDDSELLADQELRNTDD